MTLSKKRTPTLPERQLLFGGRDRLEIPTGLTRWTFLGRPSDVWLGKL